MLHEIMHGEDGENPVEAREGAQGHNIGRVTTSEGEQWNEPKLRR